ncbi:MAG TPA: pantoate--beta-alanine ligase [Armatimonadetes bacterium]|nr:pantoate--beta-alanine ligase [Armatimonadota bacterium]
MRVIKTVREMKAAAREARATGKSIGFVPTMGYFHEGHLSLMRRARAENEVVVVSLFVNPTQFGPQEDLATYPRDFARDCRLAEEVGVDLLFAPSGEEMYPPGYCTYVNVERITEHLCGRSRPGHFRGVATVVLKLFNIVQPDRAYFGNKDFQQRVVIERMVRDLNLDLEIVALPIVREPDGLALSSRNEYLNSEERQAALVLSRSLRAAKRWVQEGERDAERLRERVRALIAAEPRARIDYVALVDPETFEDISTLDRPALLALAVHIGPARLIDNALLQP